MEWEIWGQVGRGPWEYTRSVAEACGSAEAFSVRADRPFGAYIPLEERLLAHPELDVALVWDERTGWRSVLESPGHNELVTLSYLDGAVCPPPDEVAAFAADPAAGVVTPPPRTEEDVLGRLADYAGPGTVPLAR